MPGIAWKRWNWLESGLVPLLSAGTRAAWLAPLMATVLGSRFVVPAGLRFPTWMIVALLLGGSAVNRLLSAQPQGRLRAILAGLVATLGCWLYVGLSGPSDGGDAAARLWADLWRWNEGLPAIWLVLPVAALLWRRGMLSQWRDHEEQWRAFVLGAGALAILLLVGDTARLWGWALAFIVLGLTTLALLSALQGLGQGSQGTSRPRLSRHWLLVAAAAMLAVVVLGWLAGQILSPNSVQTLLAWLWPAVRWLLEIFFQLLAVLVYVIFYLLTPLLNLIRGQQGTDEQRQITNINRSLLEQLESKAQEPQAMSAGLQTALRLLALGLGLLILALLLARAFRSTKRRINSSTGEERQSIWSTELFLDQLRSLFRRSGPPQTRYLPLDEHDTRRAVRLLYRQFLDLARERGYPRPRRFTPLAFEHWLASVLPQQQPALHTLTEAYLLARYAPTAPHAEQVEAARTALSQLQAGWKHTPAPVEP